MKRICLLFLFCSLIGPLKAQPSTSDSASSLVMLHGNLGIHLPGGDLKDRFGTNLLAGAGFLYKTDRNWFWGMEADFLFGTDVKEDDLFRELETETGFMIDASGLYADVFLSERGFRLGPKVGWLIPLKKGKPDAGLMILLSPGLLQHKIRIDDRNNATPQVDDEYIKGYDRLSNGFALQEFIGYFHTGNYRLTSFFLGVEFNQAWTRSRRDWDFDHMGKDERKRFDLLNGIKFGWVIQLSGGKAQDYYYY